MITTTILLLAFGVFWAIYGVLSVFTLHVPLVVIQAVMTIGSYIRYWDGILPLFADPTTTGLHSSIGIVDLFLVSVNLVVALALFRVVIWALSMIPFLNIGGWSSSKIFNYGSDGSMKGFTSSYTRRGIFASRSFRKK